MQTLLLAATQAEEATHELPASPWVIGGIILALFLLMLMGLLSFGKGREHS